MDSVQKMQGIPKKDELTTNTQLQSIPDASEVAENTKKDASIEIKAELHWLNTGDDKIPVCNIHGLAWQYTIGSCACCRDALAFDRLQSMKS